MRISDWSSDVCSSDLDVAVAHQGAQRIPHPKVAGMAGTDRRVRALDLELLFAGEACPMTNPDFIAVDWGPTKRRVYRIDAAGTVLQRQTDDKGVLSIAKDGFRSEENTYELQALMSISYAAFFLKKIKP